MWNSSARVERNDGTDKTITDDFILRGNVTEQGLIKFFMKTLGGEGCIGEKNSLTEENTLLVIQFSSSRKRASIVVRDPSKEGTDQEVRIYCKGAPDMLFDYTTSVISATGNIVDLSATTQVPGNLLSGGERSAEDSYRGLFERTVKMFANQAYRTLLITYRDMSMADYEQLKADNNNFEKEADREVLENNLTAIGIFGLQDPLRTTIVSSIEKCKRAGISVIMCTGDNIDTAIAISKNAKIVTEEEIRGSKYAAMTGKEFRTAVGGLKKVPNEDGEEIDVVANMKKFREIKQHLRVLARSSPEDKYLLVTGIQDSDGVVAVTGDGTNDAPALTKADVGFSMGITGTDVAKGASDIILLDDNFSSIVVALKYGRNVFDNVRKFIQFQLTVNVVAMFIVFLGSVILKDSPLTAVQMLWVNLIMDTLAALALATEPPTNEILLRQPYRKDANIVTQEMWRNVFGHAVYQSIVIIMIIFMAPGILTQKYDNICAVDRDANGGCSSYNPFYTTELYYHDAITTAFWKEKNLAQSHYDQDLLKKFVCEHYLMDHEADYGHKNKFNCTDELFNAHVDAYLPSKMEEGTLTEKIIHYTFVFQAFVFMQIFN